MVLYLHGVDEGTPWRCDRRVLVPHWGKSGLACAAALTRQRHASYLVYSSELRTPRPQVIPYPRYPLGMSRILPLSCFNGQVAEHKLILPFTQVRTAALRYGGESRHGPRFGTMFPPPLGYPNTRSPCAYYMRRRRMHWLTQRRRFAGDFLAGITVASMLIPQSVSYASSLAKLSPVTGLVR